MRGVRFVGNILGLFIIMIISGCVAGQTINMTPESSSVETKRFHGNIALHVTDDRPYILDGDKDPSYIGHYRGGFGNTFDVKTTSKEPLASMMVRDLGHKLQAMGFKVVAENESKRLLNVSITDWNFDAYMNGKYWISCKVQVQDEKGNRLASHEVENNSIIKGSIWVGAKYAFEKEMPRLYSETIDEIVNGNPEITAQLQN